jgi:uncharacterized protein YdcH (DUF465 family)
LSNTPHTLGDEFPEQMDAIHALKAKSPEFAHILTEYDEVNDRIHRAEARLDAISEEAEAALRRQRLALKDRIVAALEKSDRNYDRNEVAARCGHFRSRAALETVTMPFA